MSLSETYQKKTDLEHILDAPDTYIGSIEKDKDISWTFSPSGAIVIKSYEWVPGLYKLFDEGAVNMRDHFVRLSLQKKSKNIIPVTLFDFKIDRATGVITMRNDGNGIDIAKHPENKELKSISDELKNTDTTSRCYVARDNSNRDNSNIIQSLFIKKFI